MALASLCSRSGCDSLWEPVSIELFWEPYQSLKPQQRSAARSVTKAAPGSVETRVDWLETPESHVFKADLPGLKKEEVKVDVEDGNVLKISGERAREEAKETDRWHRAERSQGQFLRKFRLPKNVQLEEVAATVENGVLTVTVPKVAEKKPEVRNIEISWSE